MSRKLRCLPILAASLAFAQQDRVPNRIDANIDPTRMAVLAGNVRPEAQAQYDQGPLDPARKLTGITLVLKPSSAQQADLEKLLEEQRDPSSPNYRNWLTPQQFADRFGLSPADLSRIASWLATQGFSVDYLAPSRNWILFSGPVAQVDTAFATEIHRYRIDGEDHYANRIAPSLPSALEPVVQTIWGLHDFRLKPQMRKVTPDYSMAGAGLSLGPGDLATIYNFSPLLNQKINGAGQKIAVVGQTRVNVTDMEFYRSQLFNLPANDPQMVLVKGSADPGITADEGEADLDLEVSGGVASGATILFVYSTDVITSVQYAVSQNLAPVITMSYGGCELKVSGTAANANALRSIAQQANAQGQTWLASTGDVGAAGCDSSAKVATQGLAIQIPASIPEVTAVGGSEFVEGSGTYWTAATPASALSYIPEMCWNDSAIDHALSSGGGGASIFFSKPAWQMGPGVPADSARDTPDIVFSGANEHDPYVIVTEGKVNYVGGTSASTPAFAGMLTLLEQYLVSSGAQTTPSLGNINPNLYSLSQTAPAAFHDITMGNNIVPCTAGSTNCTNGSLGYNAGPGYDQATGLGSMNIENLAQSWDAKPLVATTTAVSAAPASIAVTASTLVTATVQAATGTATPTGSVSFTLGSNSLGTANLSGSGASATATLTVAGNQLATAANAIKAAYSGATAFGPSSGSATVTVTVPTTASAVVPSVTPNPAYQQPPDANGNRWFFTAKLSEIAGVATTLTTFSLAGKDMSSSIVALFGSKSIAAHGTLTAALAVNVTTVPSTIALSFGGADASGTQWTQQVSVSLYGSQLSASLSLSSAPSTEVLNARGDPSCGASAIYQELNLQELNGHEVYLTGFLAAGFDLTSNINTWFGSWRVAPLGTLQANICWPVTAADLPTTYDYEIDGADDLGNTVTTTLSVPFSPAVPNPGALSTSSPNGFALAVLPGQSKSATLGITLPAGQAWTLAKFPSNQTTGWLTASPLSGTGPATVSITASSASLAVGAYVATLVLQSVDTVPQFVNVFVSLVVGTGSTTAPMSIAGVSNGASFQQEFAPGMILSVFGANLTTSTTPQFAPSVPLPFTLGGATATVNGVPAPFYYASPTQLNIQVPYETGAGYALLAVIKNGDVAATYVLVSGSGPGIFVGANSSLVPVSTAKRGDILTLFMTGEGDVSPPIATGATPAASTPLSQLPAPRTTPFTVTVAGITVTPQFIGIPYGLVGETQVNFPVPANAPLGTQSVVVTVGTVSSVAAKINITQ